MMRNRIYWTYNQRHPLSSGSLTMTEILLRLLDRLDDRITGIAADMEFRRIERRYRKKTENRSHRFVLEFETYENVVFQQDQIVKRRNIA